MVDFQTNFALEVVIFLVEKFFNAFLQPFANIFAFFSEHFRTKENGGMENFYNWAVKCCDEAVRTAWRCIKITTKKTDWDE